MRSNNDHDKFSMAYIAIADTNRDEWLVVGNPFDDWARGTTGWHRLKKR